MKKTKLTGKVLLAALLLLPVMLSAAIREIPAEKWSIATTGDNNFFTRESAKELQELLAVRIGKKIPIITSKELPKTPIILLGKLDRKLGNEAFRISRKDNVITITGGCPVGTLYGTYEFLQRYCDVWSVAPGITYAPKTKLAFGKVDVSLSPAIKRRVLYHIGWKDTIPAVRKSWGLFDKRNRISLGFHIKNYLPHLDRSYRVSYTASSDCHSFYHYIPPEKYAKTHPEYYSLNRSGVRDFRKNAGGQLCLSNPDVEKIVYNHLMTTIAKDRKKDPVNFPRVYDFSQMDNADYICFCKECKKIIDKYGKKDSGLMVWFINKVARRIKAKYPDVFLRTFAYVSTEPLPTGIRAEDNVIMQLCDLYGLSNHMYPVTDPINKARADLTIGWSKLAKNLMIWDYILQNGSEPVVPVDAIAADVKFYKKCNVKWIFMESETRLANPAAFDYLKNFVVAQMYYNPDTDLEKLLDVYCKGVFGSVHKEMRTYLEMLRKAQRATPTVDMASWHRRELKHLTIPFLRQCKAVVEKAYAANKDPKIAIHILREKNVLDNILSSKLRAYPKFAAERKAIVAPLMDNRLKVLRAYGLLPDKLKKVEEEIRIPMLESLLVFTDIPEELKKLPPGTIRFLGPSRLRKGGPNGKFIKDPDSKMRRVLAWKHVNQSLFTKNLNWGVYDWQWKRAVGNTIQLPGDEKYHWYKVVRFSMGPNSGFYAKDWHAGINLKGFFIVSDGIKADEDPNLYELWVSMKCEGPAYKKGSTKENAILFERAMLVPISKKLGNYHTKPPKSAVKKY